MRLSGCVQLLRSGWPCTVVDAVESPRGKWAEALGGIIALDVHQTLLEATIGPLESYAMTVLVLMKDRNSSIRAPDCLAWSMPVSATISLGSVCLPQSVCI